MTDRERRAEEAEAKLARMGEPGSLEPMPESPFLSEAEELALLEERAWEYLVRDWPVITGNQQALETIMAELDGLGTEGWEVAAATPFASEGKPWTRVIFKRSAWRRWDGQPPEEESEE